MDDLDLLFDSSRPPWPNQLYGVTKAIESIEAKQSCCVTSPTGCHSAGTKVVLANGLTWAIEDIVPGNLLLGPDSKPRTVLQLHRGRDMMYRISPVKGKPFVVNGSHVLSLKRTNDGSKQSGCIEFATVTEWLSWSKTKKHIMKLWKPGPVDFPLAQPLTPILIPPWELGVLLGDGCIKRSCSFDNPDKELIDRMGAFASSLGYCMTKSSKPDSLSDTYHIVRPRHLRGRSEGNIVMDELKWLNLLGCDAGDKFIPLEYLTADYESRLSLLAGLLDTDGHMSNNGFDYITKSKQLCDDVTFIARSLGFSAEPVECYKYCQTGAGGLYHRISISGDTQRIPCVIARKKAGERRQKKSWTVTGFSVEPVGIGDYYGFSLDGDQQYLTDDFFVHHNSGKTVIQIALIRWCVQNRKRVILYTNRIMLTDQTMRVLDAHNVEYGVIAATQKDRMALLRDVQLASIQTVNARVNRSKRSELWKADVVIIDEAHSIASGSSETILRSHEEHGGVLVGFTATPLGLSHLYPHLIIAARNSDCRKYGALVPAKVYAPAEMNTTSKDCELELQPNGEFSYADIKKKVFNLKTRNAIFGHVHDHWRRLNPDALPALGFAPGVAEAKWFVDQFAERGVRCASIDGEDCYIDGEEHKTSQGLRQEIVEEARQGRVAIVWNRFVLREALDWPWLHHLILATPIGSLTSYVQVIGRVLRFSEQTPSFVIIQDHGGNWWRHGSPNQDWDWERWYCANPSLPSRVRADAIRERREETAICCHKCGMVRASGLICPACGTQMNKKRRAVIQNDGTLKEMYGEPLPRKYVKEEPDTYTKWKSMVHRMRNADLTFAQAEGLFANENRYWPPPDLPMMPKLRVDKFQKIRKIPVEKLISVDEHVSMRVEAGKEPANGVVERFRQERMF